MKPAKSLAEIRTETDGQFGGKCVSLATLLQNGFRVPDGICICFDTYREFLRKTQLAEKIHFELGRKSFSDMRWEEIWDTSLRIRNMFTATPFPDGIHRELEGMIRATVKELPVVVRSSASGEDSAQMSFAGLHESYVNVAGPEAILDHVKLVWASLWSDRALLYRQELALSVETSAMGVVVQRLVVGESSGVAFSRDPATQGRAVVESVHGLNQALVDGTVEPYRWVLDRASGKVVSHSDSTENAQMIASESGVSLADLPADKRGKPPLTESEVADVLATALAIEDLFGTPQDVEWTLKDGEVHVLQARPITTVSSDGDDKRSWYKSLTRSFENLKTLRVKIEKQILPGMDEAAAELASVRLEDLSENELGREINRRSEAHKAWVQAYWDDCIPFAHGMRLFGQVYNDVVKPEDTYEFMSLLSVEPTLSLERNRMIEEIAAEVRGNPMLGATLKKGMPANGFKRFDTLLANFLKRFGTVIGIAMGEGRQEDIRQGIVKLVLEMAAHHKPEVPGEAVDRDALLSKYLEHFKGPRREMALDLLDLARASYRLRDDDNIFLAGIEAELTRAVRLGRQRIAARLGYATARLDQAEVARALDDPAYVPERPEHGAAVLVPPVEVRVSARQLTGQPAGPGIGHGVARVISGHTDLFQFKSGEVLVCDAIEPEMTFVVPLASGIVERRGGMLIHGAIIAREYGIPCVTGVTEAVDLIETGRHVVVDGYLGIVVLE